ncbi:MAG: hypothetical protein IJI42_00875 [Methanobrevibacter sp.]|nr:hypothetical protein [Methanobrevibacter sp.]
MGIIRIEELVNAISASFKSKEEKSYDRVNPDILRKKADDIRKKLDVDPADKEKNERLIYVYRIVADNVEKGRPFESLIDEEELNFLKSSVSFQAQQLLAYGKTEDEILELFMSRDFQKVQTGVKHIAFLYGKEGLRKIISEKTSSNSRGDVTPFPPQMLSILFDEYVKHQKPEDKKSFEALRDEVQEYELGSYSQFRDCMNEIGRRLIHSRGSGIEKEPCDDAFTCVDTALRELEKSFSDNLSRLNQNEWDALRNIILYPQFLMQIYFYVKDEVEKGGKPSPWTEDIFYQNCDVFSQTNNFDEDVDEVLILTLPYLYITLPDDLKVNKNRQRKEDRNNDRNNSRNDDSESDKEDRVESRIRKLEKDVDSLEAGIERYLNKADEIRKIAESDGTNNSEFHWPSSKIDERYILYTAGAELYYVVAEELNSFANVITDKDVNESARLTSFQNKYFYFDTKRRTPVNKIMEQARFLYGRAIGLKKIKILKIIELAGYLVAIGLGALMGLISFFMGIGSLFGGA